MYWLLMFYNVVTPIRESEGETYGHTNTQIVPNLTRMAEVDQNYSILGKKGY